MEDDYLPLIADSDQSETAHAEYREETKVNLDPIHRPSNPISSSPRSQSTDDMTFSSSPVLYPPSSPPAITQKRKLFQSFHAKVPAAKKSRVLGGFLVDDDSDAEEVSELDRSVDVELPAKLENQSYCEIGQLQQEEKRQVEVLEDSRNASLSDDIEPPVQLSSCSRLTSKTTELITSSGHILKIVNRRHETQQSYEQTIAQRSATAPGKAKKAYYGVDIQDLVDEAKIQIQLNEAAAEHRRQNEPLESVETTATRTTVATEQLGQPQMWTEKYRAKKFTDLVGDERTHRSVLRWLKSWDETVFPGNNKMRPKRVYEDQEHQHKKILLLTGPPGLGKTTLAHVCAKQAGYEVLEINASDDRSRDVVRGRIRDAVGTETVRGIKEPGKVRKAGRPVCVIVDEVDGVVTGSGGTGGEGGFMRALIDLVQLDQRNSNGQQASSKAKKKGDKFRLMRPLILICNDVYAPSLRPLRQSSIAEIIHVRKPALEKVISRLKNVFEKEYIACDNDAVRRLCESSWGLGTRKQNSLGGRGTGEGDIRAVLVQGEWMAHKLRASSKAETRLTRKWVEDQIGNSKASQSGLGRGGVREVVERVFIEGAGLPNLPTSLSQNDARLVAESKSNPIGVADLRKRSAISALREMIDTTGEHDRLMTDCFATYPTQIFQDDTLLSKPNASYEWLYFHDRLSSKVYSNQEWELTPYLSTSACGFHDLFAAVDKGPKGWSDGKGDTDNPEQDDHPFSGPKADFASYESLKANHTTLTEIQGKLSAPLLRLFSTVDTIATELVPNLNRMLAPEVKPVVVGGSGAMASVASVRKENEKTCVKNAVRAMYAIGVEFEKVKIESEGFGAHTNGGYALRMEPYVKYDPFQSKQLLTLDRPIDSLAAFHITKPASNTTTTTNSSLFSSLNKSTSNYTPTAPTRYAVRQVLAQELAKEKAIQANLARQARAGGLSTTSLAAHPLAGTANANSSLPTHDHDKENQDPQTTPGKTLDNIERITAIAASTASLSSAPGSSTLLNTTPSIPTAGPTKKDFFGRPIFSARSATPGDGGSGAVSTNEKGHARRPSSAAGRHADSADGVGGDAARYGRTWVSFHEGYSNAVRRYIGLRELMDGF